jgi:hypothetical protein
MGEEENTQMETHAKQKWTELYMRYEKETLYLSGARGLVMDAHD